MVKTKTWCYFNLTDYFDIYIGKDKPSYIGGERARERAFLLKNQTTNNGIHSYARVDSKNKNRVFKNFITISSQEGVAFYHDYEAFGVGRLKSLVPKSDFLNEEIGLFLITIITKTLKNNISFVNSLNEEKTKKIKIKLPCKNNEPDWKFMQDFIKKRKKEVKKSLINKLS